MAHLLVRRQTLSPGRCGGRDGAVRGGGERKGRRHPGRSSTGPTAFGSRAPTAAQPRWRPHPRRAVGARDEPGPGRGPPVSHARGKDPTSMPRGSSRQQVSRARSQGRKNAATWVWRGGRAAWQRHACSFFSRERQACVRAVGRIGPQTITPEDTNCKWCGQTRERLGRAARRGSRGKVLE